MTLYNGQGHKTNSDNILWKLSDILIPDWLSLTVIPKLWIKKVRIISHTIDNEGTTCMILWILNNSELNVSLFAIYYTHIHKLNWVTHSCLAPRQFLTIFFQCTLFFFTGNEQMYCTHELVYVTHNKGMIPYSMTIKLIIIGYINAHRDIPLLTWTVLSQPPEIKMWGKFGWYWAANTRKWCPSILSLESLPK